MLTTMREGNQIAFMLRLVDNLIYFLRKMNELLKESKFMNHLNESIGRFICLKNYNSYTKNGCTTTSLVFVYESDSELSPKTIAIYTHTIQVNECNSLTIYYNFNLPIICEFIREYEVEPYTYHLLVIITGVKFDSSHFSYLTNEEKQEFGSLIKPGSMSNNDFIKPLTDYLSRKNSYFAEFVYVAKPYSSYEEIIDAIANNNYYMIVAYHNPRVVEKLICEHFKYVEVVIHCRHDRSYIKYTEDGASRCLHPEYELAKWLIARENKCRLTKSSNKVCRK